MTGLDRFRLDGRVAIVTGAGAIAEGWGNGKATSVLLARAGATVLSVDIDETRARETADLIRSEGGRAKPSLPT